MLRRLAPSLAALVLVAACRHQPPPGTPRPLAAQAGMRFTVTLESSPSTGYRWYLAAQPNPAVVRVVSSEYRQAPAQSVGAPGDEVWTFDALAPGTATLAFEYKRPWNADAPPAKFQTFDVRVSPAGKAASASGAPVPY